MTLDLHTCYKDATENSCTPLTQLPIANMLYCQGLFVKTKKLTLYTYLWIRHFFSPWERSHKFLSHPSTGRECRYSQCDPFDSSVTPGHLYLAPRKESQKNHQGSTAIGPEAQTPRQCPSGAPHIKPLFPLASKVTFCPQTPSPC